MGISISNVSNGAGDIGGATNSRVSVRIDGKSTASINATSGDIAATLAEGRGVTHIQRTGASAQELFKDSASLSTGTAASAAISASPVIILSALNGESADAANAAYGGASISSSDVAIECNLIKTCIGTIASGLLQ